MSEKLDRILIAKLSKDKDYQYRVKLDLKELLPSIKREGQLFPILVRRVGKKLQIISGFQRVACLRRLSQKYVLARILTDVSDSDARRMSLAENRARKSLTTWDLVVTVANFRKQGIKKDVIAEDLGVNKRTIERYFRVADAPDDYKRALQRDDISLHAAYEGIMRGVLLSELTQRGRSVRYLRSLSHKKKSTDGIKIQRRKVGDILISIHYKPETNNLDQLLKQVKRKLSE